jgi:hypothetical protein
MFEGQVMLSATCGELVPKPIVPGAVTLGDQV